MIRFLVSLIVGLVLGLILGAVLGWGVFPTETVGNPASSLSQTYQDDYTAMIAAGFRADGDAYGAVERLQRLGVVDVPTYVQIVTERYITNSRDLSDIYNLVALSYTLNVITPLMEPYLQIIEPT